MTDSTETHGWLDEYALRAQVAKIKKGDTVTARYKHPVNGTEYTITGQVYGTTRTQNCSLRGHSLNLGYHTLQTNDGRYGPGLIAIESHVPALPPEPAGDVIIVSVNGVVYYPALGGGWYRDLGRRGTRHLWADLAHPVKIYRREQ